MELQSYFIMAYEHFYLGNFNKFKFYMYRYERGKVRIIYGYIGICEGDNSVLKRMFLETEISKKRTLTRITQKDSSGRGNNKEIVNLPSPSQTAGSSMKPSKQKFNNVQGKLHQNMDIEYGLSSPKMKKTHS